MYTQNVKTRDSQKPKGFYHTYNNPKREAYHEAGHIVALFLITGSIDDLMTKREKPETPAQDKQVFNALGEYQQTFNEVCFWIAGGVAERVHCYLKGLPLNSMEGDLDTLFMYAKYDWQFPFKQKKTGYPGCPTLDNLIKAAVDLITSLFRDYSTCLKLRAVADYLVRQDLVSPEALTEIRKDPKSKKELLTILKTKQ